MSGNRQQRRQQARTERQRPPSRLEIAQLAERAETSWCDHCHARFAALMSYFIVQTGGGYSVRCPDCRTNRVGVLASFLRHGALQ